MNLKNISKNHGSGIKFDSIMGNWKFVSVWKKDMCEENPVFSFLHRLFEASIKFNKDFSTKNTYDYCVMSSIQFGFLTIEFLGSG